MIDSTSNESSVGGLSSNGLVLFLVISLGALFVPTTAVVPVFVLAVGLAFSLSPGSSGFLVIWRALLTVLPLAVFLVLVWIGIIGRAPDTTLFYYPRNAASAWHVVAAIVARLFLFALLTFGVVKAGAELRPSFVAGLTLPKALKVILLASASMTDLMQHGSRRAHTALIVANVITPRMSLRNLRYGWLLVRSTWVAAVGMAAERLDTKWAYEDLPAAAPVACTHPSLRLGDLLWVCMALAALVATVATRGR